MNAEEMRGRTADTIGRLTNVIILIFLGYLLFATFRPFLTALIWSAVLSYGLYPLFRCLVQLTRNRVALSAATMSIAVTIGVILPLVYLSFLIGKELASSYITVVAAVQQRPGGLSDWLDHPLLSSVLRQVEEFQRLTGTDLRTVLVNNVLQLGSALVEQLTQVARNVLVGLTELGIILVSTFYFFRDGARMVAWAQELSPLGEIRHQLVARRFDEVVKGAVLGNTVVSALEGIIGGLAIWFVGMPAPLLWGAVMAILAYLPLVGAALVWGPMAVYLFIQGNYGAGVILCVAGVIIAVLDYVVRTVVVGGASKLHTLLTFFAVLGGIQFFGLVGIVAGPLVVAVAVALLESYRTEPPAAVLRGVES